MSAGSDAIACALLGAGPETAVGAASARAKSGPAKGLPAGSVKDASGSFTTVVASDGVASISK
jgi:hypothetical protein